MSGSGADLVYVGFNSRVVALRRESGQVAWDWRAPRGRGYVAILLEGDRIFASIQGYTYCLDALTGRERWSNLLSGMGMGVPCLASARGDSGSHSALGAEAARQAAAARSTPPPGAAT